MPTTSSIPMRQLTVKLLAIISALLLPALSATGAPDASATEAGDIFKAESFTLGYGSPVEKIIPLDALKNIRVSLSERDGVLHAASAGAGRDYYVGQTFRDGKFSQSGLVAIFQSIANYYNSHGIFGVFVVVNRDDIDPQTHEDYRPAERKDLRLTIWVSRVTELRSIAKGTRFAPEKSINNDAHILIRKYSPIQPDKNTGKPRSALIKADLDEYLLDLNRHPARRVDAAVSAGANPGEITLDYLVSETRPWFAYAQVANSGTDETDKLREHIGLSYYQLTNSDDMLLFDASTANVKSGFSASLSYDRPLFYPRTFRGKVFAAYSEFTAEDLALALSKVTGYNVAAGAEIAWSPLRLFGASIDIVPALTWQKSHTYDSNLEGTGIGGLIKGGKAETDFIAGMLNLRIERNTDMLRAYVRLGYETNFDGDTKLTEPQLAAMGRLFAVRNYHVLNFDASFSAFVEPWLFGEKFYSGTSWRKSARAHEIALTARGQFVIGNDRVLASKMMTLGGMYSIRGYPNSTIAGDNVWMGSLEYRLHVPRLFRPYAAGPNDRGDRRAPLYFGVPVNWRAPSLHALPDWDFVVRLFGDAGRAEINQRQSWEISPTLVSVGIGLEAQFKGILNARVDWGFAQKPVKPPGREEVERNSSQVYFTISLLW